MFTVDIAGLKITALTKDELLRQFADRLRQQQKTFVVTPYSEFLLRSLRDKAFRDLLSTADFALPDGIAILWAASFLQKPLRVKSYGLRVIQVAWQAISTGAAILIAPEKIRNIIPEKISGSDLIWDLAGLAAANRHSVYLLGGFGATPQRAGDRLKQKFPDLKIAGTSTKNPDDQSVVDDIKSASPDILLVAFGPEKQEQWISEHLNLLPVTLAMGVGGSFDYIAGVRPTPPRWMRSAGLEWLYRLLTQPHRASRIFNATIGLVVALVRYKVSKNPSI